MIFDSILMLMSEKRKGSLKIGFQTTFLINCRLYGGLSVGQATAGAKLQKTLALD